MRVNRLMRWMLLGTVGVLATVALLEQRKQPVGAAVAAAVSAERAKAKARECKLLNRIAQLEQVTTELYTTAASGEVAGAGVASSNLTAAVARPSAVPTESLVRPCLRKFDPRREAMVFMHIGKAAGTSFRDALLGQQRTDHCHYTPEKGQIAYTAVPVQAGAGRRQGRHGGGVRERRWSEVKETVAQLTEAATHGKNWSQEPAPSRCSILCFCKDHFDWSPIEPLYRAGVGLAPVSVMRDPVQRAISHFYFCKTLPWTAGMRIRSQTLSEYLADPESMLETRDVWQDGQAGVAWFAGVHIASWVVDSPILDSSGEKRWRERQSLNATWLLNRATRNFEKFLWVGILEKMAESLELLEYQAGYAPDFAVKKTNSVRKHEEATAEEKAKLAALMPMDLLFYNHASRAHEAKWTAFQKMKQTKQEMPLGKEHCPGPAVPMPPLPPADLTQPNALPAEVSERFGQNGPCVSTRFILKCAPAMYYHWKLRHVDNNEKHQATIPPWDSPLPPQLGEQSEQPNSMDLVG